MNMFKENLLKSVEDFFELHEETQMRALKYSIKGIKKTFKSLKNSSTIRTVIIFVIFQILLVFGIVFYKKLDRQLRLLL